MNYENIISDYLSCSIPHSQPFKDGLLAGLKGMQERVSSFCKYKCGTPDCDAFFGGMREGSALYEQVKQQFTVY